MTKEYFPEYGNWTRKQPGILNMDEFTLMKRSSGLFYVYRKENRNIKHQLLTIKQHDLYS